MNSSEYWIKKLELTKHPEGGYYKETYRSSELIKKETMPNRFKIDHSYSTCIYFLLHKTDFSAFHRIKQDELWHFYYGSSLTIHIIDTEGNYHFQKLGVNPDNDEYPFSVVKAGCWFGSEINDKTSFSLVGCTVSPGFEFDDFELAKRSELLKEYPQHDKIIRNLTR